MLTILEFHNISNRGVAWTKVPPRRFSKILDVLQSETKIISPRDLSNYLPGKDSRVNVMITFDDGYEDIYTKAFPIMKNRGITGMVSVVAGFTGKTNLWDIGGGGLRHLSWMEIEELLDAGWSICSHTMTHPDLKRCTDDRLDWELIESKALLERQLKMDIPAIAYPFGRFNARVITATRQAGYKIGFTVGAETWRGKRGALTIRRVPVYQIDSDALVRAKIKPDGVLKKIDAFKNRSFNKASLLTSFIHRHRFKGIPDSFCC